ncbi:DUF4290 domain-containing protein [Flavobacterium sp. JP2137]|uniref:DUF4290 domain-containing protein n=1 Tax=Flavobacterium sp. JP2137 TaxID=3414510 RepID=UPI003D2FF3BC
MKFNSQAAVAELEYNAERNHLLIPEYGRHLQKLIDHVVKIESREERNKAAHYVIAIMGNLNPHLRDVPDFQHKLWDQLFMMSDFRLDVDSPYPVASKETVTTKPEHLDYPQNFPKYRFYGNNIKYMIDEANKWDDGEMKDALIMVIANHMKKSYLSWNKDTVKDEVIFEHLLELSKGKINLLKTAEELSTTSDLIRVNKKQSNKTVHTNTPTKPKPKFVKSNNPVNKTKKA